jgi:MarR family transcriptional regulator, organic hydroperoxide resistance regulator
MGADRCRVHLSSSIDQAAGLDDTFIAHKTASLDCGIPLRRRKTGSRANSRRALGAECVAVPLFGERRHIAGRAWQRHGLGTARSNVAARTAAHRSRLINMRSYYISSYYCVNRTDRQMAVKRSETRKLRNLSAGSARSRSAGVRRVPAIGLGRLLREADLAFNRALTAELMRHEVTFSQYQHLWQLWKEDSLAQSELSQRIGIENSSSTAAIDQLEHRGLIHRRRDSEDRRRVIVTLTAAGKTLEGPLNACAIAVNRQARCNIPREEIVALFDTVAKITANFRAR